MKALLLTQNGFQEYEFTHRPFECIGRYENVQFTKILPDIQACTNIYETRASLFTRDKTLYGDVAFIKINEDTDYLSLTSEDIANIKDYCIGAII